MSGPRWFGQLVYGRDPQYDGWGLPDNWDEPDEVEVDNDPDCTWEVIE